MKQVAIWGGASGLGAAMVEHYHHHGYQVFVIARNPDNNPAIAELGISSFKCDATDLYQVMSTVEALPSSVQHISTMGSFQAQVAVDYIGHRHLVDALEHFGHTRLLLVTSLGCGDSWQYLSERARKGFGAAVREKSLAEAWLQSSALDYTILRPGGLKNGPATQGGQLSQHSEVHGVITRGEVARLSEYLLMTPESIGEVYQCVEPGMSY
ncbi:SDR family NAD(P)-dependent oxidoreductase [Vibrio hippocampi]|uniref:NAD(P)-binding domain-containing protein n=1 Tax=Vibrio hippocampi TaxID=654686 RepID=A0ABN8DKL1_9VIBR|nr:SDR family NAD(P)-dependent oxidoreductase [Vibrio hippocampi]CAH0526643.1 hypothetical protein VHP8226_02013 [Vibrio hippocampi]